MMKLVSMRYISPVVDRRRAGQEKDWMQIQHEQVDGIRRAVVYVSQLGCEGELELLSAIQMYA
jgi:hypothetical protein